MSCGGVFLVSLIIMEVNLSTFHNQLSFHYSSKETLKRTIPQLKDLIKSYLDLENPGVGHAHLIERAPLSKTF